MLACPPSFHNIRRMSALAGLFVIACCVSPAQSHEVLRIDANPAKGFHWAYFLGIPARPAQPVVILVEPNNSGTTSDDQSIHESRARSTIDSRARDASIIKLGVPLIVPTFPRPLSKWLMYTQALDRDTMLATEPGLVRIDLQLIAMIDDARERLAVRGLNADRRVFMWGYSASGTFTNRFSILHPDRIKAAIYGGCTIPVVPAKEFMGRLLRYPIGLADFESIAGKSFDMQAFRLMPMQVFRGEEDTNDEVAYSDGFDPEDSGLINELFGGPPPLLRYPYIEGLYRAAQANARFVIDAGVGHAYGTMTAEAYRFFEASRSDPPAPLPEKPYAYQLHFPHVACTEGWSTEIGIANTMSMVPLSGSLFAYSARGGNPLSMVRLEIPAGGRKQIDACAELPGAAETAYLTFVSDAGFEGGYTKFFRGGNRVSIAAAKGARTGVLAKMEKQGWTGIALLNPSTVDASVTLWAYDDLGRQLAAITVPLSAGARVAASPESLFGSDLATATHFRFRATRPILAFALNGSGDGNMLDGLSGLPDYLR